MGVQCHHIFYRDEIRADQKYPGIETGVGINHIHVYHAHTAAKKISENQLLKRFYISNHDDLFKLVRNQYFIQNNETFGGYLF